MKSEKLLKILLCIFISVTAIFCCSAGAFAVDDDVVTDDSNPAETFEETEPPTETAPYEEPETESTVETETYSEPETEYTSEETTTEPQTEETTEYVPTEESTTEYTEPETTEWYGWIDETTVNPTQLSTSMVSMKPYETNYAAGIVSWVCVIVGVIVIVTVLISTKHSANKKLRADEEYYSARR